MKRNKSFAAAHTRRWHTLSSSILPVPRYSTAAPTTADVTTVKPASERLTRQISRKKRRCRVLCGTFLFLEVTSVLVLGTREWVGTSGNVTRSRRRGRRFVVRGASEDNDAEAAEVSNRIDEPRLDADRWIRYIEFSINFTRARFKSPYSFLFYRIS